jgi:hypothetical protein
MRETVYFLDRRWIRLIQMVRPEQPSTQPIHAPDQPPFKLVHPSPKRCSTILRPKRKDHCSPGFKGRTKLNRRIAVYLRCFTLGDTRECSIINLLLNLYSLVKEPPDCSGPAERGRIGQVIRWRTRSSSAKSFDHRSARRPELYAGNRKLSGKDK